MTPPLPHPARRPFAPGDLLAGLVLAALVLCALPAQAQWKWRDASGRVTASDRPPPPGVAEKDILQRPAGAAPRPATPAGAHTAAAAASAPARLGDPELEARKRKAEEDAVLKKKNEEQAQAAAKKAEDERIAAVKADNCQRARGSLRAIEDGQRIARTKPNGEREFLDDAQRAAEAQRMRGVIATDCR